MAMDTLMSMLVCTVLVLGQTSPSCPRPTPSMSLLQAEFSTFRADRQHKNVENTLLSMTATSGPTTPIPVSNAPFENSKTYDATVITEDGKHKHVTVVTAAGKQPPIVPSQAQATPQPEALSTEAKSTESGHVSAHEKTSHAQHPSEDAGEHHHHQSIFQLHFTELDREIFWLLLISMLAFTILVDRLEYFAAKKAEHDMAKQMYLNRLNAELMMFGIVSTCVFVTEQFYEPNAKDSILFEFVDIFCSAGACGLFLSGLVLLVMFHWMVSGWHFFGGRVKGGPSHVREKQRKLLKQATAGILLQETLKARSLKDINIAHCEYCIMSARFERAHALPDDFDFSEYLKYCLTDSICDLMNINWISWLVVLAFTILLYAFHVLHGTYSPGGYIHIFANGVWSLAILHIVVLAGILRTKKRLRQELGCDSLKTLQDSLREAVQNPSRLSVEPVERLNSNLVSILQQTIQLVGLATSFQGSFFAMHVLYNVPSPGWRFALFAPIAVDSVVLLPLIISHFTLIKAYYSPEHEIIDLTLEWANKLETDFAFLKKQLGTEKVPLEKYNNAVRTDSKEAFLQSLVDMGIHIAAQRAFRIYKAVKNENGEVDANAVTAVLTES